MTTDSKNQISGSGNQLIQDCTIGGDLIIKNVTMMSDNNEQDEKVEGYEHLSQLERLKQAINMTSKGQQLFSTDREKALNLFYSAQNCYPKLPEPYEMAGVIQQKLGEYEQAILLFENAKKYYNDVRYIYDDIDADDLHKEGFILKERVDLINDDVERMDTNIKSLKVLLKKNILLQILQNRFMR
jgi:tetratricopeptide (TPR) repeat protein